MEIPVIVLHLFKHVLGNSKQVIAIFSMLEQGGKRSSLNAYFWGPKQVLVENL